MPSQTRSQSIPATVRPTTTRMQGWVRLPSIAERFDPRNNSVNVLRLGLAALVLVSHAYQFQTGKPDPVAQWTGGSVDLGTMAVDGFFALSGFLIVRSYLNSPSLWRYLWRRCLRIFPGFWACLLVTAFILLPIAQLMQYGTLGGFPLTGDASATSYLTSNAALFIQQFDVRGLLDGQPVNGSLYTLFYEFLCYLGVAVLGVVGVLRRRVWLVLPLVAVLCGVVITELATGGALTGGHVARQVLLRFGLMFVAGAVAQLWAHRVPLGTLGGLVAGAVLALALVAAASVGSDPGSTMAYLLLAPAAVAYLMLLAGASTRLQRIGARRDLSYGLYVYAWPMQVLLLLVGAAGWFLPIYLAASLLLGLGMAFLSWTFVEAPALALKSWTPGRRRLAPRESPAPP